MFGFPLDFERAFVQYRRVSRTPVRRRATALGLLVGLALLAGPRLAGAARSSDAGGAGSGAERQYVVRPGDTLWDLAVRVDPAEDPRSVVDRIALANGIEDGNLVPGQALVIPAGG
jgi:nucleoid-associated protein YgaU